MRTDVAWRRGGVAAALVVLLAVGCATRPAAAPSRTAASASPATGCVSPEWPVDVLDFCSYPADIRGFLEDRAACDHFRDEPWPEGDRAEDRARRRELVEKTATFCAGTDRRLAALRDRYRDDPAVSALLAPFEDTIEH